MKNLITLFYLLITCNFLISQNTFPSSGNVGIGTLTPGFPLQVRVANNINGIVLGNDTGAKFFMKVNPTGSGQLFVRNNTNQDRIFLNAGGQSFFMNTLAIGVNPTSNPNGYLLAVNGLIGTKEVMVENTSSIWPDYVFQDDYNLLSLKELEKYILQFGHLPNIPNAKEIEKHGGFKLGEMNIKLLEKIEELTLHLIEQDKRINELTAKLINLEKIH
ncbi:MAG TPA: hypothetical protein PKC30_14630 [Saprospiraceae bacterium]|nr:hypothetical protein [Saprospiraceae bacterium]